MTQALCPMTSILLRGTRGEGQGTTEAEAEAGAMQPPAEDCWQPPDAGSGRNKPFLRASGAGTALLTPSWKTSSFPNCKRINSCCFKASSFWSFVTAATI